MVARAAGFHPIVLKSFNGLPQAGQIGKTGCNSTDQVRLAGCRRGIRFVLYPNCQETRPLGAGIIQHSRRYRMEIYTACPIGQTGHPFRGVSVSVRSLGGKFFGHVRDMSFFVFVGINEPDILSLGLDVTVLFEPCGGTIECSRPTNMVCRTC